MPPKPSPHPLAGQGPWHGGPETEHFPSINTVMQKAQLRWTAMSLTCLTIAFLSNYSTENSVGASALSEDHEKDSGQLEGLAERLFKHQYRVLGVTLFRKTRCRKLKNKQTNGWLNVRHGSHSLLSRHSLWAQKMSVEEAMDCTVDFFCFCHTSLSGHLPLECYWGRTFAT